MVEVRGFCEKVKKLWMSHGFQGSPSFSGVQVESLENGSKKNGMKMFLVMLGSRKRIYWMESVILI